MTTKNLPTTTDGILTLTQSNGLEAGRALEQIAATQGDSAMMAVVHEMGVFNFAKVARVHDVTIECIALSQMSAEDIAKLLLVDPSYWKGPLNAQSGFTVHIQSDAQTLLSQLFLSDISEDKLKEVLDILVQNKFGLMYLSVPFLDVEIQKFEEEEMHDNIYLECVSGSPSELLFKIKYLSSEAYEGIIDILANGSLSYIASTLQDNASQAALGDVAEDTKDMFVQM